MGKNVFANGREISGKATSNRSVVAMPDVCLTPPGPPAGPIPIPYPNSAFAKHSSKGTRSVKIGKQEVGKKNVSNYSKSVGNEPATRNFGMGVISHKLSGPMKFAAWSMDVKAEGANVPRFMDLTTHNHSNGSNGGISGNQGAAKQDEAPDDCSELGQMVKDHRDHVATHHRDRQEDKSRAAGNHTCSAAVMRMGGNTQGQYFMAWSRAINQPFLSRHGAKGPRGEPVTFAEGLKKPFATDANGDVPSNLCGGGHHTYRGNIGESSAKYYHTESRILETIWGNTEKMVGVAEKAAKAEIIFSIDWQFPRGDLRAADKKRSAISPKGRSSKATCCDPCSGNQDSCLALLCHATECMDVYICEMVDWTEVDVPQMGGKSPRNRKVPTTYQKRNIADYCKEGKYTT